MTPPDAPNPPETPSADAAAAPPRRVHGVLVYGLGVGPATRCAHYAGPTDVVALRFACCDRWYPCHACHAAVADHAAAVWPRARFDEAAVLCGACGHRLTARAYLRLGRDAPRCPACHAPFNPGCARHRHLYFEA
jgi:uncharacterized CHY-type Zn-finger protein